MPRTTAVVESDRSTRLSVDHMATSLYAERVAEDAKHGETKIYHANPDARALYFKGIHDAILCIEEWTKMGLATNTLAAFLEAMLEQTEDTSRAH